MARQRTMPSPFTGWAPRKTFSATERCGTTLSSWCTIPMPWRSASRAWRKRTGRPSIRISPSYSACTPAMIFIKVDFPAPFSPTRPWISPRSSRKSTPSSACTPPKRLAMPASSSRGAVTVGSSDQEVLLHPEHPFGVVLGHHGPVGDHALRDAALTGLLAADHGRHARHDRAAVDAAGGVADGGQHAALEDRLDRGRHRVDAAELDVGAVVRLHH